MIEEWVVRLDRYLDDSWLDGLVSIILSGAATAGLRLAVELLGG